MIVSGNMTLAHIVGASIAISSHALDQVSQLPSLTASAVSGNSSTRSLDACRPTLTHRSHVVGLASAVVKLIHY